MIGDSEFRDKVALQVITKLVEKLDFDDIQSKASNGELKEVFEALSIFAFGIADSMVDRRNNL